MQHPPGSAGFSLHAFSTARLAPGLRLTALPGLLLAVLAPVWSADPWPQFRGINRDGISVEKDALAGLTAAGPKELWKASIGTGFTSIAVADGRVYASGNSNDQDVLHCLAADSGKTQWTYALPAKLDPKMYEGGPNATPTVADGAVYLFSKAGVAARLDAVTGKEQWKKELAKDLGAAIPKWGFSGSPTVIGDRLFLNLGDQGTCLNAATGAVVWKSVGAAGYSSPVPIDAGKRLLVFAGLALVLVEAADGRVVWKQDWQTRHEVNSAEPLIADGKVFLSTGYNFGCALFDIAGATPKELWRSQAMRNHFNGSVLIAGHLYGFDDTTLKCLEWATGTEKWAKPGLGKGSLIAADGTLIVLSDKGELVIAPASPAGFTETSRTQVLTGKCWTSPALANGQIYCRNAKGDLVCLRVR
ncbi:dehydrogenase [Planctomycetota bacterium]|nr:dehydrogenase [Planctomycetota bacterium]